MKLGESVNPRLIAALVWLTLGAGAIYLFIFEPGKSGFFPVCPFRALTGFTCPGCGSTRGLHRLLHGDVAGAFQFNPLMFLLLPFLLYTLVRYTDAAVRRQSLKMNNLPAPFIYAIFGIISFFWIFRNTSFYPWPS